MVTVATCIGNSVVNLTVTVTERADLAKFYYNLKDGVLWDTNMDEAQKARVRNMFSQLYGVFDQD